MSNYCKYYKQQKQVSYDSGQTWSNVVPAAYQIGSLYEMDSMDCTQGSAIIRWILVPGDFLCEGKDKYEKEIEQYSTDNGVTWMNVYPTTYRKGKLIETDSQLCNNKWEGHYYDDEEIPEPGVKCPYGYKWVVGAGCVYVDPVKIIRCSMSSSTTLTQADVSYSPYLLFQGTIGDCCTSIGDYAFQRCHSLTNIDIPSGVTSIGSNAFQYCTSLSSCTIGSGVTSVGKYAFSGCTSLSNVTIPDSVTSIGQMAFQNCTSLTNIDIPSGVTSIGSNAFSGCTSLSSVDINSNAATNGVFSGLTSIQIVTIGNGVTSIGNSAFNWCDSLTSITIPDSVTTIGGYAFSNCRSLTSCTIGSGVISIGNYTFNGCTSLTSITIPDNVTSIGQMAFQDCSGLTSVTIGSGVTSISDGAFYKCTSLSSITIPDNVTSIGVYAFQNCSGLTSITINATTPPTVNMAAFYNTNDCPIYVPCDSVGIYCETGGWSNYASRIRGIPPCVETYKFQITYSDLSTIKKPCTPNGIISNDDVNILDKSRSAATDVTIYECVTEIGDRAFLNCSGLSGITIPDTVTAIGAYAFSACTSLSSVTIPNSVTNISSYAFGECGSLTSATIPSGVTEINSFTFNKCSGLTSVEIPNSVTSIKQDAFSYCTSLPSITIPSGVTSIGDYAFYRCSGLTSIICEPTVPPSFNWDSFSYTNDCPIYVPCESVNSYKSDSGWKWFSSRIFGISPCGTYRWVDLDPSTDYYCSGTTKYYKQQKQVSYDSGQTWNNVVPAEYQQGGVAQEKSADCGYSGLKLRATYSGGTSYDKACDSTSTLNTGDTKPSGYDYTAMTSAEIGDCVTTINSDAFSGCTSLSSVTIPDSVTSIRNHAFQSCTSLSSITIPDNVTSIGWYAFAGCTGLTSIDIPSGVTSIDTYAFAGCYSLSSIVIPDNVTIIDNYAFQNCSGLTYITIPDSVTSINWDAFYNCTSLTSVTIGSGITSIGGYAFQNCSGLQSMTVNAVTPPTLGYNAFRGTSNFTIYVPCESFETYKAASGWTGYASRITCRGLEYRWIDLDPSTDYYCSGTTKYYKQQKQVSYDSGQTWNNVVPAEYQQGGIVQEHSVDCGYVPPQYQWVNLDPTVDYYCNQETHTKYYKQQRQVSYDGGTTWENVVPPEYQPGGIAEEQSIDCGYIPQYNKLQASYLGGNTYYVECESALTELSSGETKGYTTPYSSITSAIVGDCVFEIGDGAFRDCSILSSCTIGSEVGTIGDYAFNYCSGLTSIDIPSGVTSIGTYAFASCVGLTTVTLPNNITSIGNYAFASCSSLTSATISSGTIGYSGFFQCNRLTNCAIGNGVTSIGDGAFSYCTSLTSCTIGSGVTTIGSYAFMGCTGLTSITINASTPPSLGSNAFRNTNNNLIIYVPSASVSAYQSAWSTYASRIQAIP